jgi:putative ABC transport system substrate-binding protein
MTPKIFSAILVLLLGFAQVVAAQQPNTVQRPGVLVSGSSSSNRTNIEAFRQGMRERGYIEGQNVFIEYRYAEGSLENLPQLAVELVNHKIDALIAAGGNNVTRALKQATRTIPIVMTSGSDAVAGGLVASLARPGGNVTGLTSLWDDLSGKRLELLGGRSQGFARRRAVGNRRGEPVEIKPNRGAGSRLAALFPRGP